MSHHLPYKPSLLGLISCFALSLLASQTGASGMDTDVLGFEDPVHWTLTEGVGALVSDAEPSSGQFGLRVEGQNWRRIQSTALTSLGSGELSVLQVDIKTDENDLASWEAVGLVIQVPSQGIYWADLGQIQLDTMTANVWSTHSFALPTAVQGAIGTGGAQDIFILMSVNTNGAAVSFDQVRLLESEGHPGLPRPPVSSLPPSGELGKPYVPRYQMCSDHSTHVLAVDAEFSDVWAGRETARGGKRTSRTPAVGVEFSQVVSPDMLSAAFVPVDEGCGPRVQAAPDTTAAMWHGSIGDPVFGMQVLDFNAVVATSLSGIPDAEGAIAVGGDLSLGGFSINATAQQPVGLVADGFIAASSGTIYGDVAIHQTWSPPQNVNLASGAIVQGQATVQHAFAGLNQLSIVLASYQATGAVHSEWGAVSLTGDSTSLNVFSLSATTLAGATSLSLDIPQGSGALINVSGTVVNMRNMGFDLRGATPAQLLLQG